MSINHFWDEYDRRTTYKSFFEIEYKDFVPGLESQDYHRILNSRYGDELMDFFPNNIKRFITRSFEVIESSFSTELSLCSQKKLVFFFENVLAFIKLEKVYILHLYYPLRSGILAGENSLFNTLARLRCIIKDFKLIYEFQSKDYADDFENARELINRLILYFKSGFLEIKDSFRILHPEQTKLYDNEISIISELVNFCEEFNLKVKPNSHNRKHNQTYEYDQSNGSLLETRDELGASASFSTLENSDLDYKSIMQKSLFSSSKKYDKHFYTRLEPNTDIYSANSAGITSSYSRRNPFKNGELKVNKFLSGSSFNSNVSNIQDQSPQKESKYNFHKYDKVLASPVKDKPAQTKGGPNKDKDKGGEVTSILSKGFFSRITNLNDIGLLTSIQDNIKRPNSAAIAENNSKKLREYPLTRLLKNAPDITMAGMDTELLKLVNIDFDPHNGIKLTSNQQQQARLKQITAEINDRTKDSPDVLRGINEDMNNKISNNHDSNSSGSDNEDIDDIDIRAKRIYMERRRNALNTVDGPEFQPLPNGMNDEGEVINNYTFYDNAIVKYQKPDKEYLTQTENVLEIPTYVRNENEVDWCFRDLSPRSSRRKFLARVYGEVAENKIYEKNNEIQSSISLKEMSNNKSLHGDMLRDLQNNLELEKYRSFQKADSTQGSISFFISKYDELFKQCDPYLTEQKERLEYLWQTIREYLNVRVFYKKMTRKSIKKDNNPRERLHAHSFLQPIVNIQKTMIIQKNYVNHQNKQIEFIALNKKIKYKCKMDYMLNFDKILKPVNQNNALGS